MIPDQYAWLAWASVFTMPFGLTEPLFVPEYWSPPSLFDLALTTGFDIESLIFCFGIGGVGAVLYNVAARSIPARLPRNERHSRYHRYHWLALASPVVLFSLLYFLPWNPIYPAIIAMAGGAIATLFYYSAFLTGLEWSAPGYIERTWNLTALSGLFVFRWPLEELLFALSFGFYWSGVYEHVTWQTAQR